MTHVVLAFTRWHRRLNPHHVAIVHGDEVIESNGFGRDPGVRLLSLYDYMQAHPETELRTIIHTDPEAVWTRCLSQVGKPYDWAKRKMKEEDEAVRTKKSVIQKFFEGMSGNAGALIMAGLVGWLAATFIK